MANRWRTVRIIGITVACAAVIAVTLTLTTIQVTHDKKQTIVNTLNPLFSTSTITDTHGSASVLNAGAISIQISLDNTGAYLEIH